jgi:hypothetical protein
VTFPYCPSITYDNLLARSFPLFFHKLPREHLPGQSRATPTFFYLLSTCTGTGVPERRVVRRPLSIYTAFSLWEQQKEAVRRERRFFSSTLSHLIGYYHGLRAEPGMAWSRMMFLIITTGIETAQCFFPHLHFLFRYCTVLIPCACRSGQLNMSLTKFAIAIDT